MKNFTFIFLLLLGFACHAQKEFILNGKISFENKALPNIEIINSNTRASVKSTSLGAYSIKAKLNDMLVILTKNYTDRRIIITAATAQSGMLDIEMYAKPIRLDEVEVKGKETLRLTYNYNDMKMDALKDSTKLRNPGVYTGEIVQGMDFIQIGKMIGKLFKKRKSDTKSPTAKLDFESYVESNIDQQYFAKALDLKPDEVNRFLEFCKADKKSKSFTENSSVLDIMDFLIQKKNEFKNL